MTTTLPPLHAPRLAALLLATLLLGALANAQEQQQQPAAPATETREQTIQRCLVAMKSPEAPERRRAVLLLAVYLDAPEALTAMTAALADPDAIVRRAALVSLKDAQPFPEDARPLLFRLLEDPDLDVRRAASSMLGLAMGIQFGPNVILSGHVRLRAGRPLAQEPWGAEALRHVLAALHAPDDVVRRNVLAACQTFGIPLPRQEAKRFLNDPAEAIRLAAIALYDDLDAPIPERLDDLQPLLTADDSPRVRQQICLFAERLGDAGRPLLQLALADRDRDVRWLALAALARQGHEGLLPQLAAAIRDTETPQPQRLRLLRCLHAYGPQAIPLAQELADSHDSPALAAAALQLLATNPDDLPQPEPFIKHLDSPHHDLANAALLGLRRRLKTLTPSHWNAVFASRNLTARRFALQSGLMLLDAPHRDQLLLDACLDSDTDIRRLALARLSVHRPPEWHEMLIATLDDEDPAIRDTAAEQLTRFPTAAAQKALRAYLPQCANDRLIPLLEKAISRPPLPERFLQPPQHPQPK